ncbi:retrovirus-related pol polyprotein from transposon TNT 1-94 [Tanacetum coccineum]
MEMFWWSLEDGDGGFLVAAFEQRMEEEKKSFGFPLIICKVESENVELEFQVLNYAKENVHLKTTYKNLFDSINVTRAQTKTIIDSLQNKLHDTIYENSKLRSQLFDKVFDQKDITKGTGANIKFANQSTLGSKLYSVTTLLKSKITPKVVELNDLSNPVTSNSIPTTKESKVVENDKVITLGMFRIDPRNTSRKDKFVPINKVKASVRTKPITVSQPYVITKKDVNSDSNGLSSTGVDNTAKTRRPQPRSNTKNDRVPFADKSSCIKNKEVEVEEHHKNLLLSILRIRNNVILNVNTLRHDIRFLHQYSLQRAYRIEDAHALFQGKSLSDYLDFTGLVIFNGENILITRVYFVEGLGHNLFSVGQFCDSDLEVAFRRNTCFVKNLEGVDLLKGNRTTNLYTINLHDMASVSLIFLMAHATSTKSWLWHRRLSHLKFDTINDLAKNDLVTGLPKFKYLKEHLCPLCEQGKSKRASHPPKPALNFKQRSKDEAPEEIKIFLKKITVLRQAPNDREDIGKLGAKGDIGFFIGYSANSCAYRFYNRRKKKIIEIINVKFNELSTMVFEQSSLKPGLQTPQVLQTLMTSTTIADTAPTPINSTSQATNFPNSSQDVDELKTQHQHVHHQVNQAHHPPELVADNVPNAMLNGNTFVNPFDPPFTSAAESPSLHYVDP